MSTTQPIRKQEDVNKLKNYFLEKRQFRNYALLAAGLNTALRIGDILTLRWSDVYDFRRHRFYQYLYIREQKTQKTNQVYLNQSVLEALTLFMDDQKRIDHNGYIFTGQKAPYTHISRSQAYRIISNAAKKLGLEGHISCHSLRKTFGYHAWKEGAEPALLMNIYNHSSFQITKRYLGIDQEDKDYLFFKINL